MAKKKLAEPVELAEEVRELDRTLVIDGNTYNINAVEADTAKKVNNKLTINKIDLEGNIVPAIEYDGSENKEISVIPSTGGRFTDRITVPPLGENAPEILNADSETVLNYNDIKNYVVSRLLDNSVLFTWDGTNLDSSGEDGEIRNISLVTGADSKVTAFAQTNFLSKKLSAYIYIADNGKIYFGTSESDRPFGVEVSAENAVTADRLTNSSNFITDLASSSGAAFNGTEDVTIGVIGTLPISNGGTDATNAKAAEYNITSGYDENTDVVTDDSLFVAKHTNGSSTNGRHFYKKANNLWDYIAGKIRSAFGFSSSNVLSTTNGGTGATDLNSITVGNAKKLNNQAASYYQKKITLSTDSPSGGSNGDIWIVY